MGKAPKLQAEALSNDRIHHRYLGAAGQQALEGAHGDGHLLALAVHVESSLVGVELEKVVDAGGVTGGMGAVNLEAVLFSGCGDDASQNVFKLALFAFGGREFRNQGDLRHALNLATLAGRLLTIHLPLTRSGQTRSVSTPAAGEPSLTIVVVEDEPDLADLLLLYFRREGWATHVATTGEDGLEAIRARQPDLVVLDIGLPGDLDGLDVCRELRATSDVPVLFLTARDDEIDRVIGLELGADDYVTKPFSPREIVARVKAILRRGARQSDPTKRIEFGNVVVDLERREATVATDPISLATQEFALLELLIQHVGSALTRQQILDGAWGAGWIGDTRTVDVHVRQLRRKLGDDLPLATVRGTGYRLG